MVIIIASLLTLACVYSLLAGFTLLRVSNLNKVYLVYSFLFLLFMIIMHLLFNAFIPYIQIAGELMIICCIMRFSNHFIISMDMVSYFNRLILLLYNNLKITEPQTAN